MNAIQLDMIRRGMTPLTIPSISSSQKRCQCDGCRRKLVLSDMECAKCKSRFCSQHRLPELHACPHDFRKEGAVLLAAANPRIVADKLDRV
jgi:predicted nucleic acid binding AN1-type Zn finger protein